MVAACGLLFFIDFEKATISLPARGSEGDERTVGFAWDDGLHAGNLRGFVGNGSVGRLSGSSAWRAFDLTKLFYTLQRLTPPGFREWLSRFYARACGFDLLGTLANQRPPSVHNGKEYGATFPERPRYWEVFFPDGLRSCLRPEHVVEYIASDAAFRSCAKPTRSAVT